MYLKKPSEFGIPIAAYNIFVYSVAFLNLVATLLFENFSGTENTDEENYDQRYIFYLTLFKTLLLAFFVIMIVTSTNLLRGIVKKSLALVKPWLILSFFVLAYQVMFLSDQFLFSVAYGYTNYSALVLTGIFIIFVLQILSIKEIIKFFMDLQKNKILQTEAISTVKNSSFSSQNYIRNMLKSDPSILTPLNEEELSNQYMRSTSVNLNNFEI